MTLKRWTVLVVISASLLWLGGARARADHGAAPSVRLSSQASVSAAAKRFKGGQRWIDQGDYAAAIAEFEEAYRLDPQPVHLYNLGVAHHQNGDRDQAIDYYRQYLAAEPAGKLAPDAERYLYQLEAAATAEKAEQARVEAAAARTEAIAARTQANAVLEQAAAAGTEAKAARDRADKAELALRTRPPVHATDATSPPPAPNVDQGVAEDAHAGRAWAMPTALAAPAGTATLSDLEFLALAASYAFTDQLTMGIGLVLPSRAYSLDAKLQLVRSGRTRIAAHAMLSRFQDPVMEQSGMTTLGSVGGVITLCIDRTCRSHLSGYLGAGAGRSDRTSVLLAGASSLVLGISARVKLAFELDKGLGVNSMSGGLGWYGVRFTSKSIGLDLGFVTPLDDASKEWCGDTAPFIAFTYRGYGK